MTLSYLKNVTVVLSRQNECVTRGGWAFCWLFAFVFAAGFFFFPNVSVNQGRMSLWFTERL
jgi:hypothetical protein